MTSLQIAQRDYRLGLLVGRARERHGRPLPAGMTGALLVGAHTGRRQIITGRQR